MKDSFGLEKREPEKRKLSQFGIFKNILSRKFIIPKRKTRLQDRIKVLRFQNRLERLRLLNQIQKFKLQKRIEKLRITGQLPIMKPTLRAIEPYFSTPETNLDIASINSDISHADGNIWGVEDYYGGENYYAEDYYGTEFDNDPFFHLGIKPRYGVNPLVW